LVRGEGESPNTASAPVDSQLTFTNQQRTKRLNTRALNIITEAALAELGVTGCNLTFYLVGAKRMADINEGHMQHEGPTDVITFDYAEDGTRKTQHVLHGEIFICVDVAVTQAREFSTTWQSEVVRYIVHALLHLCGYDDVQPAARRAMKRRENQLVRRLAARFDFGRLSRKQCAHASLSPGEGQGEDHPKQHSQFC
jgi:probable rRNA maturation factor